MKHQVAERRRARGRLCCCRQYRMKKMMVGRGDWRRGRGRLLQVGFWALLWTLMVVERIGR